MQHIRIGTRDSQLAIWQAEWVRQSLANAGISGELVFIKSEGDIDLVTPLYAIGVQGIFTKTLDAALLGKRIDIAVHSLKDVPTQMAQGIVQAAVLRRASQKDVLVYNGDTGFLNNPSSAATIATSSIRRRAQWLHRFPGHAIENLRGNVNTRLRKLSDSNWHGAIFAAAGIERIGLRPANSSDLDWMLPAPAQGAVVVVCRNDDERMKACCATINDEPTAICTKAERAFLSALGGGCSTPIGASAVIEDEMLLFKGNILSSCGSEKAEVENHYSLGNNPEDIGKQMAEQLLAAGGDPILQKLKHANR